MKQYEMASPGTFEPHLDCIHELFEAQAAASPCAVAVLHEAETLTYRELNERANRLARHLRAAGVRPDSRVALCMERSLETVVALLAVLKAGGAYVPLDPSYPAERLRYMLEDIAPAAILTHEAAAPSLPQPLRGEIVPVIDVRADARLWNDASGEDLERGDLTPANLAYVIYTSGSTGQPKGVMVEHRSLCNVLAWSQERYRIGADDALLQKTPLGFDASVWEIFWPLAYGAKLVMARAGGHKDAAYLTAVIREQRITLLQVVPSLLRLFLEHRDAAACTSLRHVFCGGETLTSALVRLASEALPGAKLHNFYGPTESTIDVTEWTYDGGPVPAIIPIGRAVPNAQVYVLDESLGPVPDGERGELYLGGVQVARGYWNRPQLTAECFVLSPFAVGERLYKTGDLARRAPDGNLEFLGRADFQVKLRGFRIELGEIEAQLAAHPAVREVVVLARQVASGDERLVAYYAPAHDGAGTSAEELRAHAASALPEYMVPAAFVELVALPLSPNGKIDRGALPEPSREAYLTQAYERPAGDVESAIAQIWAELLGGGQPGANDNFFHAGGHSIMATRLVAALRARFGIELSLRSIFDAPTIAQLARIVTAALPARRSAVVPVLRDRPIPLSFAQEAVWFLQDVTPSLRAYQFQTAFGLRGELDTDAATRAINEIVRRHEVYRTTFARAGGDEPVQLIHPFEPVEVPVVDLSALTPEQREGEYTALVEYEMAKIIPLDRLPLIRWVLIRTAADEHRLLELEHHFVHDGWSINVWIDEFLVLYADFRNGRAPSLPPLEVQFADYAVWERETMRGAAAERGLSYWRERLTGAPPLLRLPTDRPRNPVQTYNGSSIAFDLDESLCDALREAGRKHGATLYMTMLAAYYALLRRISGMDDICVGTSVANREAPGVDGLIGMFVNMLVLRTDLSGDPSVHELLQRVRETTLGAYSHQEVPISSVVAEVAPARSLGHLPLYQVTFSFHDAPLRQVRADGLEVVPGGPINNGTAKYDFNLIVVARHEQRIGSGAAAHRGVTGYWEFNTDLFDRATMDRLVAQYRAILARMVEVLRHAPETPARELCVLSDDERHRILVEWNATETAYPADRSIHELFEDQAAATPGAVAVVHGDTQLSYEELNARANRLAHHLRALGVERGGRVAILLARSVDLIVAQLAVLKCGAIYVPLDESAPAERQTFILDDCRVSAIVTDATRILPLIAGVRRVNMDEVSPHGLPSENLGNTVAGDEAAYIIYTSGSTGQPKGVVTPHRAISRVAMNNGFAEFLPSDHVAFAANPAFDASTMEVWGSLLNGCRTVVIDRGVFLDAGSFARLLEHHAVTVLFITPVLFNAYASAIPHALARLRVLMCGGEQADPRAFARVLGGARKPEHLINGYGPTETTTFATTYEAAAVPADAVSVPIGRPIANTRVYIVDEHLEPVPVGVAGELYVGGPGVALGYWNRPELTAERFVASPFVEGDRLYKTGDLGRFLPDGAIEFLGRNDFQVKIRGFRIELGEIEKALAQCDGVAEVVLLAREDVPGEKRLVAYYTTHAGASADAEALRTHLQTLLPEYMVPAAYVRLDTFPVTANGKVDRKVLPAPDVAAFATEEYEAPTGELEKAIAHIWCEVLDLDRVGRSDNFFDLGGHSLLATRVMAMLQAMLQTEVSVTTLFAQPVLSDFAQVIANATRSELPEIPRTERCGPLPLSFAQQRLWFLSQMDGVSEAYHVSFGLRLSGELDRVALARALNQLVARHESMRTTFALSGGEPVQRIAPCDSGFALVDEDVRGRGDTEAVIEALVARQARAPFDLEAGPLFRGSLIRAADAEHVLLLTMHHIVSDEWSMGVLLRELSSLYQTYVSGCKGDTLPALPVQYADYAAWQRRRLSPAMVQEQSDYWRRALAGAPPLLQLPTDRVRPAEQDFVGDQVALELDEELTCRLKSLSQRHGTTMFMTLMTAWGVLLSRLSGQTDVVVGTPAANRARAEVQNLIGFFVNTLPVRMDFSGSPTVADMLARVKAQALAAQANQDLPFEQVVELVNPRRSLAHAPLFQVMFAWQSFEHREIAFPGLTAAPVRTPNPSSKFDLTLDLGEAGDRIAGLIGYATALFDRATAERHAGYLRNVLNAMVADDQQPIDGLALLSETERRQMLAEWAEANDSSRRCAHELFQEQVANAPDAVALAAGDVQLSYAELNERANRLAHYLRAIGVRPDSRVALCAERGAEMIVAMLAILKAGGAYVPLDPAYPAERLAFMLADSAPAVVLTHAGVAADVRRALRGANVPLVDIDSDAERWAEAPAHDPARAGLTSEHLAYVIYTSGSTGVPKGVMVEHRNVRSFVAAAQDRYRLGASDRVLQFASFAFDASVEEVFCTLASGAALVLRTDAWLAGASAFWELCATHGVTVVDLPTMFWEELAHDREAAVPGNVRLIIIGGEAVSAAALASWFARDRRGTRLMNSYGPTEATVVATLCELKANDPLPSIGRPLANARVYIVDERLEPVPPGVVGELVVGGGGVARGYLNHPELTAERFVASTFVAGDRLYKTGDLGRFLPDGSIEFVGRNDFQVKLRGFRIELGEIEAALVRCEGVLDAVVIVSEVALGDKRLVAYYTSDSGAELRADALRAQLLATLPEYMVPAVYVRLDTFPRTPNGKRDRKALPAPDGSSYAVREYEPPAGELEEAVARVWCDVLNAERVGRDDDFFDLGGHSLLVVRMLSRLHQTMQIELSVNALFANPVFRDFAAVAAKTTRAAQPPIPLADRRRPLPLSFAQQRMWFLSQMEGVSETYHVPLGLSISGELDRLALARALDHVVARHESLRTSFPFVEGELVQRIAPPDTLFALLEHDVRGRDDATAHVDALIAEEAGAPFDLQAGPLIRGRLIRTADTEHVLLITMHHAVSDGWSVGVLVRELSASYRAYHAGDEHDPLPPLPIQYADYAAWQRQRLSGAVLAKQAEYWRRTLAGAPELLELPTDRVRPAVQDHVGGQVLVELDAELTARVKALGQRHGTTLYMTLLTAWGTLLSRLSGQTDLVVGTPAANRTRPEVEDLIGFFINAQALRLDFSGGPTVAEMLARVKARALGAQEHQELPFEQVVEIVNPPRSLAHAPLFQVVFAWQSAEQGEFDVPGLRVAQLRSPYSVSKFDLAFSFVESGDRLGGMLEYATVLFDRATVERYVGYFRNVLVAMVADDARRVDELPLLSGGERHTILVDWNATGAPYPSERGIHELFEEQAAKTPAAIAVVHGDERLTYRELNERANKLARRLRDTGVLPGSRVAISLARSIHLVVAQLAVLKCGAIYVPLDESAPAARQTFIMEDCRVATVLTDTARTVPAVAGVQQIDLDAVSLDAHAPGDLGVPAHGGIPAYIIYTSGSTGQPKGVVTPHRAIARVVRNNGYADFLPSDRVAFAANPAFDASTMEVWGPLLGGGSIVVIDRDASLDANRFAQVLEQQQVTVLFVTTALFNAYAAAIPQALRRLRVLLCGGEQNDPHAFARVLDGDSKPQHLIHCYGPTETTTFATTYEVTSVPDGLTNVPIGRPISNTRVYIVDERLEPMPVGVAGELYVGGPGVALGYWERPELTAERFVASPFVEGDRLYKTGDRGRFVADGSIEFLGRNDFQVKIRGFRIELGEIETRLAHCAGIRDAVVLAREDVPGEKRLVAYYTIEAGSDTSAEALRTNLLELLPEYMVPAAYVHLGALPLNANGKVDRGALLAPDAAAYATEAYEAPLGEIETVVAQIWCEVLDLDRVGRSDNFFDLGGHSLLATRVMSLVQQMLQAEVNVTTIFAQPVLRHFAQEIARATRRPLPAIARADRHAPLPLSFAQQRLWFLAQIDGASEAYHVPLALRLRGTLDRVALGRALDRVVARHETLRTTFALVHGEPVQRIASEDIGFALVEHDLIGHADAARQAETLAAEEARAPFDLQTGPLIRGRLIALDPTEHLLLITMHHIVSDGWSVGVLVRELSALYSAYREGREGDPLPAPAIQYADYAAWQRRWLSGTVLHEQSSYWRRALADAPVLLELPSDRARSTQQDFVGDSVPVEFDAELSAQVKALSQRCGTTLFMTLMAAWGVLLSRLSGQTDVIVGTPIANRARAEVEGLIGFFVNTLALRMSLSDSPTVAQMLAHVKAQALAAQEHQDLPFEQVVEIVNPPRSMAHAPLFQVMFAWQNAEQGQFHFPGLDVTPADTPYAASKFDLTLGLGETGERITGALGFATALFDRATAERYVGYFRNVLAAMVADDAQRVSGLELLSPAERHQVVVEWNAADKSYPARRCLHELFEEQVAKTPDAVAVTFERLHVTYGALNARANRLARHLRSIGVRPDSRVALCMERGPDLIAGVLAILKAGGAYVPVDPAYPAERIAYVLEDSAPSAVLTDDQLPADVRGVLRDRGVPVVDVAADEARWEHEPAHDLARADLTPEHLAYIIYTSGSTGRPKGVMIEHRNVSRLFSATEAWFRFDRSDVWTMSHSIAFDFSVWEMWGALLHGGRLVVVPRVTAQSPHDFYGLLCSERVTVLSQTPGAFNQLLLAQIGDPRTHALRLTVFGGEALDTTILRPWWQDARNASTALVNMYGITETTVHVTYRPLHPRDAEKRTGSPIGKRIPDVKIYILDELGEPVPAGVPGELYVGGAGVARGYWNRPELTEERFIPSPFLAGDRLYKTGDLGRYLPDGSIEFLGRNDDQVKIRGFRLELGEIEARLAQHDAVRHAVVVVREDAPGEKRLVAYYTAANGTVAGADQLRAHAAAALPDYMVPAAYVALDALPLTPSGKLDRKALPAPEGTSFALRAYEPPIGDVENAIADIWCDVLDIERVGRTDNFFELGGHSFLVVRVIDSMRRAGLHTDVRAVFTAPTLIGLASTTNEVAEIRL